MKWTNYFFLFLLVFASCAPATEEIIVESWPDGGPQLIRYYLIENQDSILLKEVSFYESGTRRMEGEFNDACRHGLWKYWYEDGTLRVEGYFKDGERTGSVKAYHPNGEKKESGTYENGQRVGRWKFWDENAQLLKEIDYDNKQ